MPLQADSAHSSGGSSSTVSRLLPIDGLRGYLALWVLVGHVLWLSGFEPETLAGLPRLFRTAQSAVDLFIIISGSVIMLALDK